MIFFSCLHLSLYGNWIKKRIKMLVLTIPKRNNANDKKKQ